MSKPLMQALQAPREWIKSGGGAGFAAALALVLAVSMPVAAGAQGLHGTQRQGQIAPIPIAIPEFSGDPQLGRDIADVVVNDLAGSGLFVPLNRGSFLDRNINPDVVPTFANWTPLRAQALTVGSVSSGGARLSASFRLWDVVSGKQLTGQKFTTASQNWRRLGHLIADRIYQRLTGEGGYFDTRIVFISETGSKKKRVKRLAIMDQDGHNMRFLSGGRELVLTPRFNPTRQEITYVSYGKGGKPKVYVMDLATGKRSRVGNAKGVATFAPRFSPDGRRIAMSLQTPEGISNIYELSLASRRLTQLTASQGIDTSPSYSPDGSRIVIESDREGSQQLYVMEADGGGVRRISFGQGLYSTPVWSPRGDLIAFTKQLGGRFLIGVMRPDGSGERILTEGFHNEGPTWAPNGRVLMFFRESRGVNGGPSLYSVDLTGYNERRIKTPSFASDPAWSPLLR